MTQLHLAQSRTSIVLAQELGRGGEGTVFSMQNASDRVAKLYTKVPDATKVKKLTAMVVTTSPALLHIAAWPIDLLLDGQRTVRGFVMPRVTSRRDIHELYSPKSRSESFPETDFRFLVHVGTNIARAFAVIHAHGHVVGDVNHGNLLVGTDGTVMMIDCDSFQVGMGTNVFPCDVGVPLFTAPELHGRPLRGLIRTSNHDHFGLAVLLFHLLYMGRHPFAGKFLGPGEMPIEKAVAEYRFAYGPDRAANAMERPPGTIPLEAMGMTVTDLFIRAFERAGSHGGRPSAEKWINALEQLESSLRLCSQASWHHYPRELAACPWCGIEAQTGVRLFGQRIIVDRSTGTIDLAALWQAIASVPAPSPDPLLPSEQPWQPPQGMVLPSNIYNRLRRAACLAFVIGGLAACNSLAKEGGLLWGLAAYVLAYAVWPHVPAEQKAAAERAHATAKGEWENSVSRWRSEACQSIFKDNFHKLEKARSELADLPIKRQRAIAKLESERETHQRHRYLDRFRIDRAEIPGIGSSRTAMLASYGIETAADVERGKIHQIPGFGQKLTGELLKWRRGHEQNFRFNPAEPLDWRDMDALDRALESQREDLLRMLRQGPEQLRRASSEVTAARTRLMPLLDRAWNQLKIAEASLKAL